MRLIAQFVDRYGCLSGIKIARNNADVGSRQILDFVRDQQATNPLILAPNAPQDGLRVVMTTGEQVA